MSRNYATFSQTVTNIHTPLRDPRDIEEDTPLALIIVCSRR